MSFPLSFWAPCLCHFDPRRAVDFIKKKEKKRHVALSILGSYESTPGVDNPTWGQLYRALAYTPYEGLNLANQNNRKLEVFGRKLEETSQNCIDILINISEIEIILFN